MLFVFSSFFILSETRFVSLLLHFAKGFLILIFTRTGGDGLFGFPNLPYITGDRAVGPSRTPKVFEIRQQCWKKNMIEQRYCFRDGRSLGATAASKRKKESFRLRIENPITPSPPSLRSFLLSVVSSRSAACRRATTTAGRGRRHHQDHDHQYDVHHIVLVRLVILFVFSLPFLCFNKCGRGKRDFPVSFCSWWICDLGLWLFLSHNYYYNTTTSKHKQTRCGFTEFCCFLLLFLNLLWLTSFL